MVCMCVICAGLAAGLTMGLLSLGNNEYIYHIIL